MKLPLYLTSLAFLLLLGAGCASSAPRASSLHGTTWTLASFNSKPTPEGQYLAFDNKNGYQGKLCNSLNGTYSLENNIFISTNTAMTKMACVDERMQTETAFAASLSQGLKASVAESSLTLTAQDGSIFIFVPGTDPN